METHTPVSSHELIGQYIYQLIAGCDNSECKEVLCATGRRNTSSAPVRSYTALSARSIALAFTGGPDPRGHLCRFALQRHASAEDKDHPDHTSAKKEIDPTSIEQMLCSTDAFKKICAGSVPEITDPQTLESRRLYISLEPLFEDLHGSRKKPLSNAEAAARIVECFVWIHKTRSGPGYPERDYENPQKLRLMMRVFEGISLRTAVETFLDKRAPHQAQPYAQKRRLLPLVMAIYRDPGTIWRWARHIFRQQWDFNPKVNRGNAVCGALEVLESIYNATPNLEAVMDNLMFRSWDRIEINEAIETYELASSWAKDTEDESHRHILSFKFILQEFNTPARSVLFRIVNHLKMREVHTKARIAWKIRERFALSTVPLTTQGRLKHAEGVYLLLNVSRGNVLQDSFNQIWQRRQEELLRPLRVRLGEIDQIEVGQDLGGVQIEFFNLICKEVFALDSEFFESDSTSHLSYFRPMSLQPLYKFEMIGLLIALALYNGITLPLNLPLFLYRHLMTAKPNGAAEDISTNELLNQIRYIWPDRYKSLVYIQEHPEMIDTNSSFPVEANGLRIEARATGDSHHDRIILEIFNATADRHHKDSNFHSSTPTPSMPPVNIDGIAEEWPGWYLIKAAREAAPVGANQFIRDYILWLTYGSIQPQLEAFKKGFTAILDNHSLSLLAPQSLQKLLEGSTHLDVHALRKSVSYKGGYTQEHPYIKQFWSIVTAWIPETQMKLIKFVTAAERIPNGGPESLTFVIDRADPINEEALPTSSTCFGELKLPMYKTKTILEEKLLLAMEFGLEGFGTA